MFEQTFHVTSSELTHRNDLNTIRFAVFERAPSHDANPANGACQTLEQHAYEPRANRSIVGFVRQLERRWL